MKNVQGSHSYPMLHGPFKLSQDIWISFINSKF